MPDSKNSGSSPLSSRADPLVRGRRPRRPAGEETGQGAGDGPGVRAMSMVGIILLLAAISVTAARWCFTHGYVLYYGDAEAHLNIARRVLDSRTPGPEQIGTVWLPLPHAIMTPFAMRDAWWRNGLAGTIPSAACFILAGVFLFAAARRAYGSQPAALAVALLFGLSPNMLYLQSTPMTEPLFAASLAMLLWACLLYTSPSPRDRG